ncbi:MAG: recombinase family protein [Microbacterium sp.]|uniref:recombinase family protein n=1 Tax=Microbacterium sp. TaxID=51671 RepID=UPI003F801282
MTGPVGYVRGIAGAAPIADDLQRLRQAGVTKVYIDSRAAPEQGREEWERCLQDLTAGDTLVVVQATAVATSVEGFVTLLAQFRARGIHFRSLTEPALTTTDTLTSPGDVLDALDTLRRRLIGLRIREGLEAAVASGRRPGRPRVMTNERIAVARELRAQRRSFAQIGRALGVSEAAVRRALASPESDADGQRSSS